MHRYATGRTEGRERFRGDALSRLKIEGVALHDQQEEGGGRKGTTGMEKAERTDFHEALGQDVLEEPAEQRNGVEDGWTSCAGGVRMAMTMRVLLGLARALCFALASVLGATLLTACASTGQTVRVPWRAGNAESFQMGVVEERQAHATQGVLPVTMYRPAGAGPFPFIVLLHGCGGLQHEASWTQWVRPWADLFRAHGIGTAVVDIFGPRGVDQVCTGDVAAWAVRRADDAYSTRAWLAEQPDVDAKRIAVMGMSNGGRTVLAALRTTLRHPERFVAGVALYPGCQTDVSSNFYAPLLVLIGKADTVSPAHFCEQMHAAQPASVPELRLIVYPRGPHTFDMRLPDRTVLGMRLGYDPQADADARRQVIDFLAAYGFTSRHSSQ